MRFGHAKSFLIPALAIAAGLIVPSTRAETVNVPFDFIAQGHSFPSGVYSIETNPGKHLVTLHSKKANATLNWSMGPGAESNEGHVLLGFSATPEGRHVLDSVQYGRRFTVDGNSLQPNLRSRMPLQP